MKQLDVPAERGREALDVVMVGGDDLVPVVGEQYHRSIDHVGGSCSAEQPPGGPSQRIVEWANVNARQRLGESSLTRSPTPHLSDHASVGDGRVTVDHRRFQADPHSALVALQGDKRAAVKNDRHADFAVRPDGPLRPRTTVAPSRSARAC